MSYPASLRQQAKWIREALDPATPLWQRIDLGDVDVDELEAAADYIDALVMAKKTRTLEINKLKIDIRDWQDSSEAYRADCERLRKALEGIAEFCSTDATKLGAIDRLISIQNTATQALRASVGGTRDV